MAKEIMVFVKDARYYQEQGSILVIGAEVETRRQITQQILTSRLAEAIGLPPSSVDDHAAWRKFAADLKARRHPFKIAFEGDKTEEDPI